MPEAKTRSWKVRIADAIQEMGTIDLDEDTNEWPTIHWLISNYLLRETSEYERFRMLPEYVAKIKNNLYNAIWYLREGLTVPVYWDLPNKSIVFLTTNAELNEARKKNTRRIKNFVHRAVKSGLGQLVSSDPEEAKKLVHAQLSLPELK